MESLKHIAEVIALVVETIAVVVVAYGALEAFVICLRHAAAGVQSTTLTLNVLGSQVIATNTAYILIAGTDLAQLGASTSQYSGLTFGTSTGSLATGLVTPILNSGNGGSGNVTVSMSGGTTGRATRPRCRYSLSACRAPAPRSSNRCWRVIPTFSAPASCSM